LAQKVGRGIALLFHDRGTKRGVSGQQHATAVLYPRERPGTHFKVNVKCSRHRSGVAQRVGRGIALLFHDRGTRRG